MSKLSKGRITGIVACSLAAVSLAGVGFATWVVGTREESNIAGVTVKADDVSYESLTITADFKKAVGNDYDNTIALAGKDDQKTAKPISYRATDNNGLVEDLKIKGKFTITAGNGINLIKEYKDISFSIASDRTIDNKIATDGNKLTGAHISNTDLVYFDCPEALAISDFTEDTSTSSYFKTYTKVVKLSFSWGNFFKGTGDSATDPISFYNNYLHGKTGEVSNNTPENLQAAYEELKAMYGKYSPTENSNKTLKLKMTLNKQDSSN